MLFKFPEVLIAAQGSVSGLHSRSCSARCSIAERKKPCCGTTEEDPGDGLALILIHWLWCVWQDSMMQGDLANTMPLASSAAPLGLPAHHHTMSQGISPLPAAAFNLPWLPENHAMH